MLAAIALAQLIPSPPNIVLIVADDLGYGDIGNVTGIPTPNIDAMMAAGTRFDRAYSVSPICAPSRAGLLTGQYPERFGFYNNYGDERGPNDPMHETYGVPTDVPMLQEILSAHGYSTGMFGKWHLGYVPGKVPTDRGFGTFWGFLGEEDVYLPTETPIFPFLDGTTPTMLTEYQTDELGSRASDFIRAQTGPYFCYVPFGAVHSPWEATDAMMRRWRSSFFTWPDPTQRRRMAAMVTELDKQVGSIETAVRATHKDRNTIVVFCSDNGGSGAAKAASSHYPLDGWKWMMAEGGIRVPLSIKYPARVAAGAEYPYMVSLMDIMPTVLQAAGLPLPPVSDGVSLMSRIRRVNPGQTPPHKALFFSLRGYGIHPDQEATLTSDGMKYQTGWTEIDGTLTMTGLFDVVDDPGETNDLSVSEPDEMTHLINMWHTWRRGMAKPAW